MSRTELVAELLYNAWCNGLRMGANDARGKLPTWQEFNKLRPDVSASWRELAKNALVKLGVAP